MTTLVAREQRALTKRCAKCHEVKALEDFRKDKRKRDGRESRCRVCKTKSDRERHWAQKGIPESEWSRLHQEADRKAEAQAARHSNVPDGFKRCTRCHKAKPLAEFPPDNRARDGRQPQCHVCKAKYMREERWTKEGIPPETRSRLHKEADRQRRMRELAAQHGLKYCADCNMCLGRGFFHRDSRNADGRQQYCKVCQRARVAAHSRTPEGRAVKRGSQQRRRAKERDLPTDGTTPRDWAAWAEEHEWFQCHLCGGDLNADDEIHWDHVEPVSTGSAGTVLHNMRAAHAWCNLSRGNRPIDEWRAAMGLTEEIP